LLFPLLCATDFVSRQQHPNSLREQQRGEEISFLPFAEGKNRRIVGGALGAATIDKMFISDKLVDRHQFHSSDAQRVQVVQRRRTGQACISSAQALGNLWMARGKPFDVKLINECLMPRRLGRSVVALAESRIDDDALRKSLGAVAFIGD
jgi:hypothetical protein